jgi:prepilin-type N-terminal cleavage/methylation domain-containing protein/prepilin-type processing-associated H-X9-DG protein
MLMGRSSGFTLIELLVVIAIIVILVAISVPVFLRVRAKTRQSGCASNMRQVAMAVMMYADDCDETLPYSRHSTHWLQEPWGQWHTAIEPYVRNRDVYRCPSVPQRELGFGPCCNVLPMGGAWPVGLAVFDDPSAAMLFIDLSELVSASIPYDRYYTHRPRRLCDVATCETPAEVCIEARHNGGLNVAFLDGHVRWMRPEQALSGDVRWCP